MYCVYFVLLQRILEMDGAAQPHEFIYIDEAGFNLSKTRRRGRNIIGQRASPGAARGKYLIVCCHKPSRATEHIITFLDALHDAAVQDRPKQPRFVFVWDNISFHWAALVHNWFTNHHQFEVLYLPPYTPFLNPIE